MTRITRFFTLSCLVAFSLATLFGCVSHIGRSSSSAPLGTVIEPAKDSSQRTSKAPLRLPASVAIVTIVPNKPPYIPYTTLRQAAEELKQQLLKNPKYIRSVAVVARDDMQGMISLENIQEIYGAEVAITLSYQQDQRSSQSGAAGLMDVAIVGIFLVPGVEIKTSSVIDGRVIHIPSDSIIFRASGTDERSTHSTTYSENSTAEEESINSILASTTDFGNSLSKVLTKFDNYDFSQAVPMATLTAGNPANVGKGKPANDYWRNVDSYKATGGGAFGILPLLISSALCWAAWRRK